MQSPPLGPIDVFTLSRGTLRLGYVWDMCGICEPGRWPGRRLFLLTPLIVDCSYGISLLRSLNFEVFQAYVISLQLDSFSGSVARKLCSSLKTFGRTCKNPAATWLLIWAPLLLSWVSRSLTLFLLLFSWVLAYWSYFELLPSSNNIFCVYIQFPLVFFLNIETTKSAKMYTMPAIAVTR